MHTIQHQFTADKVNMGGIVLDQALPLNQLQSVDPFLLIHHWADTLPGNQKQRDVGVGPHPHRGFAPVTFVFKGAVHHQDSIGVSEVVQAGGTQWMNSGSGIVHSERPSADLATNGGAFEIIQFWVNAPAAKKMEPAKYQPLDEKDTPTITSNGARIQVVAGHLNEIKGPIDTYSPLQIFRVDLEANAEVEIPINETFNSLWYQLDGLLQVNEKESSDKQITVFTPSTTSIKLKAKTKTRGIILAGEPINEPVQSYGPFVMNTQQEIVQAIQDYQSGKMGVLKEKFEE